MRRVLFVCTGNICRSPSAEGVFGHLAGQAGKGQAFEADSAGTHGYHIGEPPDWRAISSASARGLDIAGLRARKVSKSDFIDFDTILAMDRGHLDLLRPFAPAGTKAGLHLFSDFSPSLKGSDIPDPYYGGQQDFEDMMEMIWAGCEEILQNL